MMAMPNSSKPTSRKLSYWEKLKHPNWQKKRLEILDRAKFECEDCGAKEDTLHVHHSYYEKGLDPWEYPDASLHCLCEDCHKKAQDRMTLLHRSIGALSLSDTDELFGYARALQGFSDPDVPIEVFSFEMAMGVANYWNLRPDEVISALVERAIDSRKLSEMSQAAFQKMYAATLKKDEDR